MILLLLAALTLTPTEKSLVGSWECRSGPCIDPEIEFAVEDGKRVFRSWLHHRPGTFGTWSVEGKTVTIVCCGGNDATEYRIVKVTKRELVLRPDDADGNARYRRIVP